jgi:protein-S-isoprenylcysteine O-methyltransferase Ste14
MYDRGMTHVQQITATVATAACWGTIVVVWVAGAVYNAARGPRRRTRLERRQTVLAAAAVIAVVAIVRFLPDGVWDSLRTGSPLITALGLALLVASTAFTLWARAALGTMWSADTVVKEGHRLRTDGPYGVTRHPIYTGMLGMLLGTVLVFGVGRALMILPVGLTFFAVKIRAEERLMSASFPDEYPRYRQRVPQLIPLLRRPHRSAPGRG